MSNAHILVVDDEPDIRQLVMEILEDEDYEITVAENAQAAREARRDRRPDLILLDIWMPDTDGISLLKEWASMGLFCPVIMMSGHGTVETAVEATRLGAYDFIEKPLSMAKLLVTVERALEADKLARENADLKKLSANIVEPIGKSEVMQKLREQARRIAQHDTSVLISGESGSGKELFAHYLHSQSQRRSGSFVGIGVGTIERENSAVEFFGREAGNDITYGHLEQANQGCLYLDDVVDMDLETQGRLLSALETRSFMRIGGNSAVNIDVRVIAATSNDIVNAVSNNRFRSDLYYHMNVVPLVIPPLREHNEDVPELLEYYVNFFVEREKLNYRHFSFGAQNRLRNYAWPGNIRELKNLVQRLLILGGNEEISLEEVEQGIGQTQVNLAESSSQNSFPLRYDLPLREAREQFERDYLLYQLKESGGSVGKLSKTAGMERTHLYRKLRSLGIDPKQI